MAQPSSVSNPGTFKPINTSTTIGAVSSNTSQMHSPAPATSTASTPQGSSPTKEVNIAVLCKNGQEMVQDIVQKTQDIFKDLKVTQLPNGTNITPQMVQDKRAKLEEHIRSVNTNFRNLLKIYNKVKEYKENIPIQEYLPIEEDGVIHGEKPRLTESFVYISEEHKELIEQIQLKNQHIKEIIDQLRMVIWEINTMMAIKRS